MTLEKDLAAFGGAGGRVEVVLPILCPSGLLDHPTCTPIPQGLDRWFVLWKQLRFWRDGVAAANKLFFLSFQT